MVSYKTNDLLKSIKRRISLPANQNTFTDDDFLQFANEELSLNLVPDLMELHEDYLLFTQTVDIDKDVADYPIPHRAVGNKLRDVQLLDTNDNHFEMSRISVGDIPDYEGTYNFYDNSALFYIQHNRVHLIPPITTNSGSKLKFYFYLKPSEIVSEDRAGVITNINTDTGEITVNKIPEHFSLNLTYDLYKAKSPHRQLNIDITPTSINSTTKTITFNPDDLPRELEVGDHVAQAEECIIPQVPSDLHVLLAQYTAERILEAIGDTEGLRNAQTKSKQMEYRSNTIIDNRAEEAPVKMANRNGPLTFASRRTRYRRGSS